MKKNNLRVLGFMFEFKILHAYQNPTKPLDFLKWLNLIAKAQDLYLACHLLK